LRQGNNCSGWYSKAAGATVCYGLVPNGIQSFGNISNCETNKTNPNIAASINRNHKLREALAQLEHIEAIEKRLWSAADNLRANSNYASNEYFLPVMGLVFLRHAYSRYLTVKEKIEPTLPKRGGKSKALSKEDFSKQSAIFLQPKAQFDSLVSLPDSAARARAIIEAMESIEADYENLRGVLPKGEYQELDNDVLGELLRTLNPDELKKVSGDVFGRIYEYFLTQFADQKAHDAPPSVLPR
jgi:type I restriction enzyme M protein